MKVKEDKLSSQTLCTIFPSTARQHATTMRLLKTLKAASNKRRKTSGGRNHDGVLLVVQLITQLKVFLCVEAAWGERDDKRG